jgi:hypothetical protein
MKNLFTTGKALLVFTGDWNGLDYNDFLQPSVLNCEYISNPTPAGTADALEFDEEVFHLDVLGGDQNGVTLSEGPVKLVTDLDQEQAKSDIERYLSDYLMTMKQIADRDMKIGGEDQFGYYEINPRISLNFRAR